MTLKFQRVTNFFYSDHVKPYLVLPTSSNRQLNYYLFLYHYTTIAELSKLLLLLLANEIFYTSS